MSAAISARRGASESSTTGDSATAAGRGNGDHAPGTLRIQLGAPPADDGSGTAITALDRAARWLIGKRSTNPVLPG